MVATYRARAVAGTDVERYARSLAELQSSGAWVDLAGETDLIRRRHAGRVLTTWEITDLDAPAWGMEIAYPTHNTSNQIPLLLATVYGECASWRDLKLIDLALPEPFVSAFKGPPLGSIGSASWSTPRIGRLLVSDPEARDRAHPERERRGLLRGRHRWLGRGQGRREGRLAAVERLPRPGSRSTARAATAAYEETGHRTLYFVNITDRPDRLLANAHAAVEAGASALLVNAWTVGVSALSMLADDPAIGVPIMAHLAFTGALSGAPWSGMSPHLVLGTLPRLAGADVEIYPSHLGTLPFSRADAQRVGARAHRPVVRHAAIAAGGRRRAARRDGAAPGRGPGDRLRRWRPAVASTAIPTGPRRAPAPSARHSTPPSAGCPSRRQGRSTLSCRPRSRSGRKSEA